MIQNASSTNPPAAEFLFHRALDLSGDERAAFLASACGNDAALRQRLEALLRANDASCRFLPDSPSASSFDALPADRVIGDHELAEEIARGDKTALDEVAEFEHAPREFRPRVQKTLEHLGTSPSELGAAVERVTQLLRETIGLTDGLYQRPFTFGPDSKPKTPRTAKGI